MSPTPPDDRSPRKSPDTDPETMETEVSPSPGQDAPTASLSTRNHLEARPSAQVGPYRLLRKLGEGGMGEVWEAEQDEPVRRRVALKIIKRGMDSDQVLARFEAERQALAMMDHPAIAKIFDAGTTPRGRPYFAMEQVKGIPAVEFCDRHNLGLEERLELFMHICEGVQHAHQKGVIHRDLKPSNILVTSHGDEALPKIIDFGLAKATEHRLTERTMYTELGTIIGTPDYMSPEQAEMSGLDVDTRTDVYSLGVILYQLLVGVLPFDPEELRQDGYDRLRQRIREDEPLRPSSRYSRLGEDAGKAAARRNTDRPHLQRDLKGDLDWIVMKAMDKDRRRRYQSPLDVAADIQRHLRDEPILAMPPSAAYRTGKFVRRHTAGVVIAATALTVIIAFAAVMAVQAGRIARERDRANLEARTANRVASFLTGLFQVSDPGEARGNSITAREILDRGAGDVRRNLDEEPLVQARMMNIMGEVYSNLGLYDDAKPLLEDTLAIRRQELGATHLQTLDTMEKLGILQYQLGNFDGAEPLFTEVLSSRRALLGNEHPATLNVINSLANLRFRQRRLEEALALYEEALPAQRRILGNDHQDTLDSMNNLGALYRNLGRLEEAAPLIRKAWERRQRVLSEDHPKTVSSLRNLSALHYARGDYQQAEPLFVAVLESWRRTLGPEHPNVLIQANNLASLYRAMGRLDDAESLARETLATQVQQLGDLHPTTLVFKDTLANILLDAGQVAPSQALYQEILEGRHGVMGAGHTKTLETLDKLLASYTEQGQLQAARRTLEARLAQIPGEDVEARAAYQERLESLNETGS